MANREKQSGFQTARSLIAASGLNSTEQKDAYNTALARALYVRGQVCAEGPIEPYSGRNSGTVNMATTSILLDLSKQVS